LVRQTGLLTRGSSLLCAFPCVNPHSGIVQRRSPLTVAAP